MELSHTEASSSGSRRSVTRTLVVFHAHPDDESIATGGVIAQAADAGHRVVLVVATRGEHGEVIDGVLEPGEALSERRTVETMRAAEILGIARVEFLGYIDSGMAGTPQNHAPGSFWTADIDEAAARLEVILRDEDADVLIIYDEHGVYDHPDHIQVHRVGVRAAELADTPTVYEATVNRDEVRRFMIAQAESPDTAGTTPPGLDGPEELTLGTPDDQITTRVDVRDFVDRKRAALAAHATQVDDTSFFLGMTPELFRALFGQEWFIRRGATKGPRETSLF